jgi:hypothetical protein
MACFPLSGFAPKKKPAWWNTIFGVPHAGLLVNKPLGTTELPFNQSSDL